ncbi:uncharacterized protein BXZ73DRAFT_37021 [Epithele typhae]|uniref:uncharacterized protein n=1 Tax=Epithele typhae TaxID=378194 RepID=UPI0020088520|nr:uncharacterized protein BXZ73DRAFT_37021 [Epithele typhae]KAH9946139.1 hypothetical protein BXZ73DRAFT_37021 [Epithele typhae]
MADAPSSPEAPLAALPSITATRLDAPKRFLSPVSDDAVSPVLATSRRPTTSRLCTPPASPRRTTMTAPASTNPAISTKGWQLTAMCDAHENFEAVRRVSALNAEEVDKAIHDFEAMGIPIVIQDWDKLEQWDPELFSLDWLTQSMDDQNIRVRNVHNLQDSEMPILDFVKKSRAQSIHRTDEETERLYWKDADCPQGWRKWLRDNLPGGILPGNPKDLLRHLPKSKNVESMMCYLGIGDTFTASHKDIAASTGHNLMCFSEHGGSSYWFMTKTSDAATVAEYFQETLHQELDWENHVTTIREFGDAPFTVYVTEQKVGDLILVPSRGVHQVVNQGGLAMKASWSRMTFTNMKDALHSELLIYRRVCRPEQYRVKATVYSSLLSYTDELRKALELAAASTTDSELVDRNISHEDAQPLDTNLKFAVAPCLIRVLKFFQQVLRDEYDDGHDQYPHLASDEVELSHLACDFCGADIFQSFFECSACGDAEGKGVGFGLIICPGCYVEGRTCECDNMTPSQCRPINILIEAYNGAARILHQAGYKNIR